MLLGDGHEGDLGPAGPAGCRLASALSGIDVDEADLLGALGELAEEVGAGFDADYEIEGDRAGGDAGGRDETVAASLEAEFDSSWGLKQGDAESECVGHDHYVDRVVRDG